MVRLGIAVCVQPHFIAERGAQYLSEVEPRHLPDLYRLKSLAGAGLALAGGSDAPFASADPWQAMAAAVARRTREGSVVGGAEALSPQDALALYLADSADITRSRTLDLGETADVCLLARPWSEIRNNLGSTGVRATIIAGNLVHQAPA
jgi:predicted amidohydrolase YtcJ